MEIPDITEFQQRLNYHFKDISLLKEALRHSSFVNEQDNPDLRDNERLEFLGDAVLNLVVGDLLMRRFPDLKEGDLSRIRSGLVNESRLASLAIDVQLNSHLLLGKGELLTKGHRKESILANAFEALIAAIYLDSGYAAAYEIISFHFTTLLTSAAVLTTGRDYKSRLQEKVQERQLPLPQYSVIEANGPDHDKTFRVQVSVENLSATGEGKSKKTAEQKAAKEIIKMLRSLKPS